MTDEQFNQMMKDVQEEVKRQIARHIAVELTKGTTAQSITNWIFDNYEVQPGGRDDAQ